MPIKPAEASVDPRHYRSDTLSWTPLKFYTLYRLTLAGLLAALFFMLPAGQGMGSHQPWLYGLTVIAYLLFALLAGFLARLRQPGFGVQVFVQILVDILAIVALIHAGGGLETGLGILLILAVVAGALLLPGRLPYFFAATASLAMFGELALTILQTEGLRSTSAEFTRAGLLGMALFLTATLAHLLAVRIRESEALAAQRGVDLANLARLNEYVVQRLQSGILVVDEQQHLHLSNDTALDFLQCPQAQPGDRLPQLCPQLAAQLKRWRNLPDYQIETFSPPNSEARLMARFTALGKTRTSPTLIFLEDAAALAQQAQQMKLAALGRLTASIAHEIRNPLGAISHAGQLLGESDHLDSGEQRLIEIIRNHSQRVNHIIENVLQLSRRSQNNPKDIGLVDWLHEFVEELRRCENLAADRVLIEPRLHGLQVHFDPSQLHQVVWNLTHNALQHGGQHIELRIDRSDTEQPCLEVLDDGPGIPAALETQIFEPFFTTASSGTGLGLYLARELCELNAARLDYIRRPQGGSCFRITFSRHSL